MLLCPGSKTLYCVSAVVVVVVVWWAGRRSEGLGKCPVSDNCSQPKGSRSRACRSGRRHIVGRQVSEEAAAAAAGTKTLGFCNAEETVGNGGVGKWRESERASEGEEFSGSTILGAGRREQVGRVTFPQ